MSLFTFVIIYAIIGFSIAVLITALLNPHELLGPEIQLAIVVLWPIVILFSLFATIIIQFSKAIEFVANKINKSISFILTRYDKEDKNENC